MLTEKINSDYKMNNSEIYKPGNQSVIVFAKKTAFVHKLYAMLSDKSLSNLIWWSRKDDDCVFALHPGTEFANILTNYFKHGNVSSFVRQLHMYGFHKVFDLNHDTKYESNDLKSDDLVWEFRHSTGYFRKGDESSLNLIKRRSSNKTNQEDNNMRSVSPSNAYYLQQQQQIQQHQHLQHQPVHQVPQHLHHPIQLHPAQHHHNAHHAHHPHPHPYAQNYTLTSEYPRYQPYQPYPYYKTIPDKNLISRDHHQIANELIKQQSSLANQSENLHKDLRLTASDVLKITDQIPQIIPILKRNSNNSQYQEHLNSIQQNFLNRAESYIPSPLSSNSKSSLGDPFGKPRQESIHFWDNSNNRHPSLVDPLYPSPNGSVSSTMSGHYIPSIDRSKSNLLSPSSSPSLRSEKETTSSLPHLYQTHPMIIQKRSESLDNSLSPKNHRTNHPPRSVPEDYKKDTNQLRPSVTDLNQSSNNHSISSNSTHNTLYSAHSSISSISSRNSNGSFSGLNDLIKKNELPELTRSRSSTETLTKLNTSNSKLSVSSLLTTEIEEKNK